MACKQSEFQRVVNAWTLGSFIHPTRLEIVGLAIRNLPGCDQSVSSRLGPGVDFTKI